MTNKDNNHQQHQQQIRGDILKDAMDSLGDVIGPTMKEMLIEYIERQDIILDNKHYYRFEEIYNRFLDLFGKAGAPLLVERSKRNLFDI